MPKIPTFTTQVRPTAEVAGVKSNLQIPLNQNIGTALEPLTKAITDFAVKEKIIQDKTEALTLENESILELNTAAQEASKLINKGQANLYFKSESDRIKSIYSSKASSSSVKNIFENNYLAEEQKQIYKVDNAVFKNIVQNSDNQKQIKSDRLLREYLFADNLLAKEVMYNSLVKLENDDLVQDEDSRLKNIALIPRKIDYFTAKHEIGKNPIEALKMLGDKNKFINLDNKTLNSLRQEATALAAPEVRDNASNYLAALEIGKIIDIDEESINVVLGKNYYQDFKEKQSGLKITSLFVNEIFRSKKGEEDLIISKFEIRKGSEKTDIQLKQKLFQAKTAKEKLFKDDPAKLILSYDPLVQEKFNSFVTEQNSILQQEKGRMYVNTMKEAQREMGVHSSNVKLMTKENAVKTVSSIMDQTKSWKEQKGTLDSIIQMYGAENAQIVFNQLSSEKLPIYVQVAMATNSLPLSGSILSSAKIKDLEKIVQPKLGSTSKETVQNEVSKKITSFEEIINSQPEGSVGKENYILGIRDTLYKATLDRVNQGEKYTSAATTVTDQFLSDYDLSQETYFIPKDVNKIPVAIQAVKDKADQIKLAVEKTDYLERFFADGGFEHYARTPAALASLPDEVKISTPEVFNAYIKDKLTNSMKKHSKWLLNSNSTGIVLYVDLAIGLVPIINAKGQKIEFFFTDQPNQDTNIKSTDSFEPGTGRQLPSLDQYTLDSSQFGETYVGQ